MDKSINNEFLLLNIYNNKYIQSINKTLEMVYIACNYGLHIISSCIVSLK